MQTSLPSGRIIYKLVEIGVSQLQSQHATEIVSENSTRLELYTTPQGLSRILKDAPRGTTKKAARPDPPDPGVAEVAPVAAAPANTYDGTVFYAQMDLWGLAVTSYEMMTGHVPWLDGDPHAAGAALRSMYEFLQVGECSEKMHRFVTRSLALDPTQRFASAAEMRAEAKRTQFSAAGLHYDAFISYRVRNDAASAQSLFKLLASDVVADLPLYVFLDKVCLVDGERWDQGFMTALCRSRVFVPLLSAGSLENMCRIDEKAIDNVLLEWAAAIELYSREGVQLRILKIVPLFLGNGWWQALSDKARLLIAHATAIEDKLRKFLVEITGDGSVSTQAICLLLVIYYRSIFDKLLVVPDRRAFQRDLSA